MRSILGKKGQGVSAEYVIVITLVTASIGAMIVYVQRTLQGRMRDATILTAARAQESLGNAVLIEYEPYYVKTEMTADQASSSSQRSIADGKYGRTTTSESRSSSRSIQLPF